MSVWNIEDIMTVVDEMLDTKRKRHVIGGVLLSASLFFGGLSLTIMTLKGDD